MTWVRIPPGAALFFFWKKRAVSVVVVVLPCFVYCVFIINFNHVGSETVSPAEEDYGILREADSSLP